MRLILAAGLLGALAAALWAWQTGEHAGVMHWALARQREAQNELASLMMAARRGEPGIVWGLVAASGLYGFVHALGPGHGKVLIGGAALAGGQARAMAGIAVAASLAQGLTAVALVYGGLGLLAVGTGWALGVTEALLIPLGHAAIAGIGALLLWRGARVAFARRPPRGDTVCGCGHRHGPAAGEVARLSGWRDALALIGAIAVRPCTGAVMVLVIAWQTGLHWLGLAAVAAMALGTALLTALAAIGGAGLHGASLLAAGGTAGRLALAVPALQIVGGGVLLASGVGLLSASLA